MIECYTLSSSQPVARALVEAAISIGSKLIHATFRTTKQIHSTQTVAAFLTNKFKINGIKLQLECSSK